MSSSSPIHVDSDYEDSDADGTVDAKPEEDELESDEEDGMGGDEEAAVVEAVPKREAVRPIVWDPTHNDPLLDTIIVSRGGTYLRASSHVLKRESAMFRDMLSVLPHPFMTTDNAIPLDFESRIIAIFLDAYTSRHSINYALLQTGVLRDLHSLVDLLVCDRLLKHVTKAYRSACRDHPTDWLVIASEDDDMEAAKAALLRCRHIVEELNGGIAFELAGELRKDWRFPFLQCIVEKGATGEVDYPDMLDISWPDQARVDAFEADVRRTEAEE